MQALTFLAVLGSLLVFMKACVYSFGFLYQGDSLRVLFSCTAVQLKKFIIYLTSYLYKESGQKRTSLDTLFSTIDYRIFKCKHDIRIFIIFSLKPLDPHQLEINLFNVLGGKGLIHSIKVNLKQQLTSYANSHFHSRTHSPLPFFPFQMPVYNSVSYFSIYSLLTLNAIPSNSIRSYF